MIHRIIDDFQLRNKADNHPVRRLTDTPPESGGEPLRNSPPQLRRGGAPSDGVVLSQRSQRGREPHP